MAKYSFQSPHTLLRIYLVPITFLLILYLLIIGGGSMWLYLTVRQAQTELTTTHIVEIVSPFLKRLNEKQQKNSKKNIPFFLSQKVSQLYQTLPSLSQISIRDQHHGYGVRTSSKQQLVDVELEPLKNHSISQINHQQLSKQLHEQTTPLFHIYIDYSIKGEPIQLDVAFNRAGLVGKINNTLQSIIHSIIGFIIIGILSIIAALAIAIYTGVKSYRIETRLQNIYQQASMGRLSASFVHDLRNPLASIRANIKNLLITPDETDILVDEMDDDILRLEQKLTDFLKLTKPRNSGFESIDITLLVNDLIQKSRSLFEEKNISVKVDIDSNIPIITAISEDIRDALFNLLVNAINHTQRQGYIWIHIKCQREQVTIIVENNGSSIQPALLTKIFNPFFTTRTDGHGLGLAIVKQTVEAHHGSIIAENRSPSGARFIMTLPIKIHD